MQGTGWSELGRLRAKSMHYGNAFQFSCIYYRNIFNTGETFRRDSLVPRPAPFSVHGIEPGI